MTAGYTPKPHDPHHPYVRRFVGCGHGVLFRDYCLDCEIVDVRRQYSEAVRRAARCRDRLRELRVPLNAEMPATQPQDKQP